MKNIFVLGSLNADLVQRVERLPAPGETIEGSELQVFAGGKGANQACAAARLGARVTMAGRVGADVFGARLKAELEDSGVETSLVKVSSHATGAATILVLPSGDNVIVISPGANAAVTPEIAVAAVDGGSPGDLLLCQLEIPLAANHAALRAARRRGMITILDPAPAAALSADVLREVSILTPNQTEAAALLGAPGLAIDSMDVSRNMAALLLERGPEVVIIKMGRLGCLVARGTDAVAIDGHSVEAVDTTAAGDTFNGALAAALSRGEDLLDAARFANAAAALSVTMAGAMQSIPTRAMVAEFLDAQTSGTVTA